MTSMYVTEIMRQNFDDLKGANIFKLGILLYLKENGYILNNHELKNLSQFIYRIALDNFDSISKNSTNVIINNIIKYEPEDINNFTINAINEWMQDGCGILSHNNKVIFTNVDSIEEHTLNTLNTVAKTIISKITDFDNEYSPSIKSDIEKIVKNCASSKMELFKKLNLTRFRNRALESNKYCFCCNDTNIKNLSAVPILLNPNDCVNTLILKDNNLVLCQAHFELYAAECFKFDENGKIVILKVSEQLDRRMRISFKSLTKERKKILYLSNSK